MSDKSITLSIPSSVKSACRAIAGAQFRILTAAAVWAHTVGVDKFEPAAAARATVALFPDLSDKTIGNYYRSALRLAKAHSAVITANPDATVYAAWLKAEALKLGYTCSEPDLIAMVGGKASMAQRKALDEETRQRNADVAAAAAAAPTLGAAADKPAEPAPTDPTAAKDEPAPTEQREALAADKPAEPAPTAKPADKPADAVLISLMRRADGSLYLIDNGATRAELVHCGLLLTAALDAVTPTEPRMLSGVTGELIAA